MDCELNLNFFHNSSPDWRKGEQEITTTMTTVMIISDETAT